jgi:hypothetical protein
MAAVGKDKKDSCEDHERAPKPKEAQGDVIGQ